MTDLAEAIRAARAAPTKADEAAAFEASRPTIEQRASVVDISQAPTTARSLAKLSDWSQAAASRGPVVVRVPRKDAGKEDTKTLPTWQQRSSIVLRGRKGERRYVASWLEGNGGRMAFECAFAHHVGRVTSTQLHWYLTQEEDIPWLEGLAPLALTL